MELIGNDLSLHGQFHEFSSFRRAIARMLAMRNVARRFGREVQCNRALLAAETSSGLSLRQAVGRLPVDQRRSALSWLTRHGPFWTDLRRHDDNDYLECHGDIVTDSAVGEAAYRSIHGVECALVSFVPSDWEHSPVDVVWRREAEGLRDETATVANWWTEVDLEAGLAAQGAEARSWRDLYRICTGRFARLKFADDSFAPLAGTPFAKSSAERIVFLLGILDRRASAFEPSGAPTPEAYRLQREYFSGETALFSDSSAQEKRDFRGKLTFRNPDNAADSIECTWHGKERRLTLRVHFSWPIRHDAPVYVVYVGPKLTKR